MKVQSRRLKLCGLRTRHAWRLGSFADAISTYTLGTDLGERVVHVPARQGEKEKVGACKRMREQEPLTRRTYF